MNSSEEIRGSIGLYPSRLQWLQGAAGMFTSYQHLVGTMRSCFLASSEPCRAPWLPVRVCHGRLWFSPSGYSDRYSLKDSTTGNFPTFLDFAFCRESWSILKLLILCLANSSARKAAVEFEVWRRASRVGAGTDGRPPLPRPAVHRQGDSRDGKGFRNFQDVKAMQLVQNAAKRPLREAGAKAQAEDRLVLR